MKKLYYLVVITTMCLVKTVSSQDAHFSQFFEAPLLRNPSLAGLFAGDVRVQAVYRNQWGSVGVPFKTTSLNAEYKQPVGQGYDFITMGMQLLQDKAGTTNFTTTNVLPALNYHKALSGDKTRYLSLGFMGGWVQRRIDRSKITTNSQFDGVGWNPSLADGEQLLTTNYNYWDASVGMSYNSTIGDKLDDIYFLGLAYHHFNRPKNSFYKNPNIELSPKLVASAGVKFGIDEVSYLTLQGDYSKQADYKETILGALYSYKIGAEPDNPDYIVHFGGFMRVKDAFIPVFKLDYKPFTFAISYDINVSQLRTASQGRGGLELSLSYSGFLDRDNSTRNSVLCPRF
ncbi:PorP/SprF family type IX secretion system membrane protein [Foetidibacter luteolus]|uniref:PorP/SprF family type IX secretion system membrane protein n=1 Tax=Foetidibacter luteolus TaxID=2608880 RepID=UPI00129BC122|nr:PorP/SprF family type IX secretion system membrane protein [Foetidibacter luteolus]